MYTVDPVDVPQDVMKNFDLLSQSLKDSVTKEWVNRNVYQTGDDVEFIHKPHEYNGRKGSVIDIISMYGGAQDWVMIEEHKTGVLFAAAMWQVQLIEPPKEVKHGMTRITMDEFNAKLNAAERITRIDAQRTKTRDGTYYNLYIGLNYTTWFVGLALNETPLAIIVERVG